MKNHDDEKPKPNTNDWAPLILLGQVGFTIVFSMLVGLGIGLFIDHQFHTTPIATIIGLLLGLAAGVYGVYRLVSSLP
ncbi:MAG TPA: AtpZ/AtpI family protein [Ktedonobacterales bacterium]|jgi:F0F1-type ATP synthase assembly protein I